jgi:hypothetical protein
VKAFVIRGFAIAGMLICLLGFIYGIFMWSNADLVGKTVTVALGLAAVVIPLLLFDTKASLRRLRAYAIGSMAVCSVGILAALYWVWGDGGWSMLLAVMLLGVAFEGYRSLRERRRRHGPGG